MSNYENIKNYCQEHDVTLVAVSKTQPIEAIEVLYDAGQRDFGENKVQELLPKHENMPKDIRWHLIGHLQSNKVKQIAHFIQLIHSVDSVDLLREINKQAAKQARTIDCLIQIHIAEEETKFGFSFSEAEQLFSSLLIAESPNIRICGMMGMASFTDNKEQVRREFRELANFFKKTKQAYPSLSLTVLSMGMSGDYDIACEEGSNMVRIGSALFGARKQL